MHCTSCGSILLEQTDKFCSKCGSPAKIDKKATSEKGSPLADSSETFFGVNKKFPLKTKWLTIWNYFFLPISGINNTVIAFTTPEISIGLIATTLTIVQFLTAFGLYYRKIWAWRLNWFALVIAYFSGVILPRFIKQSYGFEEPDTQLVLRMIVGILIWIWPNYVYWKKRKELFTN